uniref:Uncharacterized protein n=1 Tax=Ananas comosus var. bracteatus TaxID=296719 RepID=A0A6V7P9E1_ANACO|nr:unnamed protein product [Ananas comosus var. bracteatus]
MASSTEIFGVLRYQKSPRFHSPNSPHLRGRANHLCFPPASLPLEQGRGYGARKSRKVATSATATEDKAVRVETEKPAKLRISATVTVRRKKKEDIGEMIANQIDACANKMGRSVVLELVSTEIDPITKGPKTSKPAELMNKSEKKDVKARQVVYTVEFTVESGFGEPGAITVLNRHHREFFLESVVADDFDSGPVHFTCQSWVQPARIQPKKRVFFTNKPYLPSETPPGLRELREQELKELRGDGTGERKLTDRIYDYATYNDLGNPDKGTEYARRVLGGDRVPYPRRLRTGRPPTISGKLMA